MEDWFVLKTKSNCERISENALFIKGIQNFVPRFRKNILNAGRPQGGNKPIFPGYVFVHPSPTQINQLHFIPGSCGLLMEGGHPGIVTEKEIKSIQSLVNGPSRVEVHPHFEVGEKVVVVEGPFRGIAGMVVFLKKKTRLIINAALLKTSLSVEIDPKFLVKAGEISRIGLSG